MNQGSLRPLWQMLLLFKEYYGIIFIYSVCISVLALATPISVQSLVNTFAFGPYFQPIFILSLILLALLIILGVLKALQFLVVEYLQRKLYAKITAFIALSYSFEGETDKEIIRGRANRYFEIILVYKNLAFLATDGVAIAFQTFVGLVLISLYHPFFIVFGLIIILAIIAPVYLLGGRALGSAIEESNSKFKVADYIDGLADNGPSEGSLQEFYNKTDYQIGDFLKNRSRHFKTLFIQKIIYIGLYAGLNALLLALGGFLVIKNQLTVGQLVAAEIAVNAILSHFLYASKYLEAFYDMYASIHKVQPFFIFLEKKEKDRAQSASLNLDETLVNRFIANLKSIRKVYSPTHYKRIFLKFVAASAVIALMFAVIPWQQFSQTQGRVVAFDPNDRVQTITAQVDGIVEEWLVNDGQFVKKGTPIVRVVDNDPQFLTRLESARDAAVAKFEAAREASDTAKLNFHRQEKLMNEGLSSRKEYEQAKIKYKKLQAEEAVAASSLAKAEVELSRQQQQEVLAPRDGQILRILVGSGTSRVKEGDPLVQFVPETQDISVELFVDANDLPLVFPGRKVRLQFEGWPAVQFSGWPSVAVGSFGGIVSVVDPSVGDTGNFRVLVKPDPDDPEEWPDQQILRQGTRVNGIINLDQVTIGYELWRQVNGFPKSMNGVPAANGEALKK